MTSTKRTIDETFQTSDEVGQVSKQAKPTLVEQLVVVPETMVVPMEGKEDVKAMVRVDNPDIGSSTQRTKSRDVLFCVDCSGSMHPSMSKLHDMLHHIPTHAGSDNAEHVHVAICKYSSETFIPGIDVCDDPLPYGYAPWAPLNEMSLAGMMNFTSKYIFSRGSTNMHEMIKKGLAALKDRRVKQFGNSEGHLQHLVIMTDGIPDYGQTKEMLTATINDGIGNDAVVVSILLLGSHVNLELSEAMSVGTTRGVLAYANKAEDLSSTFDEILTTILKSARAFNVKINDKKNDGRVFHFGVLTENNNTALMDLNFGSKIGSDKHLACTLVLSDGVSDASCVMPYYAEDENDDAWKSEAAKMPEALKTYMDTVDIEKKIKNDVMQAAETDGFKHASHVARTLTQQWAHTLTAPALQRLHGFSADLVQRSQRSDASTMPAISRRMSAAASYSQSVY